MGYVVLQEAGLKIYCFTDISRSFIHCFVFYMTFLFLLQLNPDVNVFQRKFVNEVRRCEEMDRKLRKI